MRIARSCVAIALVSALAGCPPEHAPPGDEGAACSDAKPCQSGLTCVDGTCARIVADAGPSDALIGDLTGRDLVGLDLWRPDSSAADQAARDGASGTDLGGVDGARPDATGHDGASPDSQRPDGAGPADRGWLPDGVHLPDGWTRPDGWNLPDGWSRPDGWSLPDGMSFDLWFLRDADLGELGLPEGGLGFDAAIAGYTGSAEDGVVCAAELCSRQGACCVAPISTSLYCDDSQPLCGQYELTLECDGPEDCGGGQECCSRNLSTFCVAAGTCYSQNPNNVLICVDSGDCTPASGFVCCASQTLNSYGLDLGWCQASCG